MQDDRGLIKTGTPGVYKRGNRFVAVWRHGGRQHKSYHRTLSEAKRAKAQRTTGDTAPPSRQRFDEYARSWAASTEGRTRRGLSDGTRASYEDAIERKAVPYFGSRRLGEISAPIIRDYIRSLAADDLSAATVRRYVAPVRALFASALEDGILTVNPAAGVRVIVRGEARRRPKTLTPDQTRALIAEVPDQWRDLVVFLAFTGARIGEALAATWGDLGQEDGSPVWFVRDSKTDAGVRSVRLTAEFTRRLTRRRSTAAHAGDQNPVFGNADGVPTDSHNFRHRVWRPAARRAGVEWATPHMLRHSLASLLFERGHTAAQVAATLGHADPGFTLRTYIHARETGDVEFLDQVLGARSAHGR